MRVLLLAIVFLTLGCTTKTQFGECVGISDPGDPRLVYRPSVFNIVTGIVFMELIFPPVIVVVDQFYCPVGKRDIK